MNTIKQILIFTLIAMFSGLNFAVYAAGDNCNLDLPNPMLEFTGTEDYDDNGKQWTRYSFNITNSNSFPNELFRQAPDLPPCGLNTNSSRTWVDVFESGNRIYGFCGFSESDNLNFIWFAKPRGESLPGPVHIQLNDRGCEVKYTSNTIRLDSPDDNVNNNSDVIYSQSMTNLISIYFGDELADNFILETGATNTGIRFWNGYDIYDAPQLSRPVSVQAGNEYYLAFETSDSSARWAWSGSRIGSFWSLSFILTTLLVFILYPLARTFGLTDKPCSRKQHLGEIPLIGGISIYLCTLILLYWLPIDNYWYIVSATLIVACGVIDDYKPLDYKTRLTIEIFAIVIMITWGGIQITSLGNLFGFGEIQLGYLSPFVTIFAVLGGINAFNMMDGIDGTTGGISLATMELLLILAANVPQISAICALFIPALIAFLLFNARIFGRKKASIFLGDAGSTLLGFTICYMVIFVSQGENRIISPVTVLWILALPLLDAVCIMIRRIRKGDSPFAPDREHFHHILQLAGHSVNQTLNIILFTALSLGGFGILGEKIFKLPEWLMFYLFIGVFALFYWEMNHTWKVMKTTKKLHTA